MPAPSAERRSQCRGRTKLHACLRAGLPPAQELRLGELPVLMADYRRLARVGWAHAVQQAGGLEALLAGEPAAGEGSGGGGGGSSGWDLLQMPGRFLHLRADELRMREVGALVFV